MSEITAIEHPATAAPSPPERKGEHRRSLRWRALAGAGTVTAATAGVLLASSVLGGSSGRGPAAFAFETISNDTVSIRVVNSDVAAKEMTKQLHAQGLTNVSVRTLAVQPQLVGLWSGFSHSADVPSSVADMIGQQTSDYTTALEVPAHFDGDITFFVGRAAKPGDKYVAGGELNALAPAGPLHCLRLSGADPDEAATRLSTAGYIVHWIKGTLRPGGPTFQQVPVEPEPGSQVVYATVPAGSYEDWPTNSKDVYLRTAKPDSLNYERSIWRGYPADQREAGARDYSDCPPAP